MCVCWRLFCWLFSLYATESNGASCFHSTNWLKNRNREPKRNETKKLEWRDVRENNTFCTALVQCNIFWPCIPASIAWAMDTLHTNMLENEDKHKPNWEKGRRERRCCISISKLSPHGLRLGDLSGIDGNRAQTALNSLCKSFELINDYNYNLSVSS